MRFTPLIMFLLVSTAASFSIPHVAPTAVVISSRRSVLKATAAESKAGESEAERLFRLAKEMRAKAEEADHNLHNDLAKKKAEKDARTDALIEEIIFGGPKDGLVDRLRNKKLCMDTLEHIVDRLDEREVNAEGQEHVEAKISNDRTVFERVAQRDEEELERIQGRVDDLIAAVKVLDQEFKAQKENKGEAYVTHTEELHWGGGKVAERLDSRYHEIRREREEQFQKRMEEFREAQRVKKDSPPPPKVKDDHRWLS
jgi:hypothetical protein